MEDGRAYFVLVCDVTLSFVALCFVAANVSSSVQHALVQDKHDRNQDGTTPSFQRVAVKFFWRKRARQFL